MSDFPRPALMRKWGAVQKENSTLRRVPQFTTSQDDVESATTSESTYRQSWVRRQTWPLVATTMILFTGMAFSFWWGDVAHHVDAWFTPPDLWSTFRDAHWIGWRSEGAIYGTGTGLVTFPGIAVLLTPLALLQTPLHLTASYPLYLAKPTEWYLLGPVDLLSGAFVLYPLNTLASILDIHAKRRTALVWVEAALVWPVVAIWGHPEDSIAFALAMYGFIAVYRRTWLHAGFFLGLAVAFQPLVLLLLPLAFSLIPIRRWPLLVGEIAIPSAALLFGPLVREWGPTTRAIFKQPNYPQLNHPTPWLALAPKMSPTHYIRSYQFRDRTLANGVKVLKVIHVRILTGTVVAAGPERDVSLLLAIAIGFFLFKRAPSWPGLIWWMGVALALRCVFESILDPFYFYPGIALALFAAFTTTWRKISLTLFFSSLCTWLSYWHTGEWTYYLLVVGSLIMALGFSYPPARQGPMSSSGEASENENSDSIVAKTI